MRNVIVLICLVFILISLGCEESVQKEEEPVFIIGAIPTPIETGERGMIGGAFVWGNSERF